MYLVCHVTSHDQLIERSWKFMGRGFPWFFTTLISLLTIEVVIVEMTLMMINCFCGMVDLQTGRRCTSRSTIIRNLRQETISDHWNSKL